MTPDQVISVILSVGPSVLAIITTVILVCRTAHEFTELKKQVNDMREMQELNNKMSRVLTENADLKKLLRETLEKIDHVERKK